MVLISSTHDSKKEVKKKTKTMADHQNQPKRSGTMKSRIKEMGPICKSRKKYEKDSPARKQEDDDEGFVWLFNNQVNQKESSWLSSESFSPLYKNGDLVDEKLISFLSSYRGISFFDGKEKEAENGQLESSCLDSSSDSLARESSLFWDVGRTDMWVSLINLDGEDCKWISNVELDSENIESSFPSPTYKNKRSFDVESSFHDELSSEILSGSLDLDDVDFDEPLMWPFNENYDSSYTLDIFCQSPRRGFGQSKTLVKNEGRKVNSKFFGFKRGSRRIIIASRNTRVNRSSKNSMKTMLSVSATRVGKKNKSGKGSFVISAKGIQAMSVVNIDEFSWWPCGSSTSSGFSTTTKSQSHSDSSSMDFNGSDLWVSPINLNLEDSEWISGTEADWEEGLESNFPSPSYKNRKTLSFHDELTLEILSHHMDSDEPLFWPYDEKDQNWSMEWDDFCTSPRKGIFGNPTSIRVRIHDQKPGFKRRIVSVSGLSATKINNRFKPGCRKKIKALNPRSGARKLCRNGGEIMEAIMENDVEGVVQVEKTLGLQEFDGHEGIDMEFHTDSFSILEE